MGKMRVPEAPRFNITYYKNLKGVDYSQDITEVSKTRTPNGVNMISDNGGNPVKRLGWRVEKDLKCGEIIDIIMHREGSVKTYIVSKNGVYADGVQILNKKITSSSHFMFNGEVYLFVNEELICLKNGKIEPLKEYIPEVTISKNPDGTGGVSLESVNLLTPKRTYAFLGNDKDTEYNLYPKTVAGDEKYKYIIKNSIKVELLTSEGWKETQAFTLEGEETLTGLNAIGIEESYIVVKPKIKFSKAHPPLTTGYDNIKITFIPFDNTDENGKKKGLYKERKIDLLTTNSCMTYGYIAVDRVFAVGGKKKNRVYFSEINKPNYFPDNNYVVVGHDSNGIVGLHRISEYLVAIKEDSAIENTVFLISGDFYTDKMFFKVTPTSAGTGAISSGSFATLIDEPLFLTRSGIFAIANYYTTTEKVLRNRSLFLDKKLLKEPKLEKAQGITWQRYYLLAINDHCYILDGRNKTHDKDNTDYAYESYYWENIPVSKWYVFENELYFGTKDGKLCKFNTDIKNRTAYCDDGEKTINSEGTVSLTGGKAIYCNWETPLDDDGRPQNFKSLNKKGTLLTMLPYEQTSAKVTLAKDGDERIFVGDFTADIQTWEVVDFLRFTFNSNDTAQDAFFRKKVNKYKRLKIIVENNGIYEPFGLLSIVKTYSIKNFSKNRG